jgi:hypothetical protein
LGFLEIILSTSQIINGTISLEMISFTIHRDQKDISFKSTNHPENVGLLTPVNTSFPNRGECQAELERWEQFSVLSASKVDRFYSKNAGKCIE